MAELIRQKIGGNTLRVFNVRYREYSVWIEYNVYSVYSALFLLSRMRVG